MSPGTARRRDHRGHRKWSPAWCTSRLPSPTRPQTASSFSCAEPHPTVVRRPFPLRDRPQPRPLKTKGEMLKIHVWYHVSSDRQILMSPASTPTDSFSIEVQGLIAQKFSICDAHRGTLFPGIVNVGDSCLQRVRSRPATITIEEAQAKLKELIQELENL